MKLCSIAPILLTLVYAGMAQAEDLTKFTLDCGVSVGSKIVISVNPSVGNGLDAVYTGPTQGSNHTVVLASATIGDFEGKPGFMAGPGQPTPVYSFWSKANAAKELIIWRPTAYGQKVNVRHSVKNGPTLRPFKFEKLCTVKK